MRPINRAHLAVLGIALGPILIAVALLWLRLVTPFDGARLEPAQPVWKANGVVVTPVEEQPGGLREGDLVVGVDGRSLEAWAQTLFQPDVSRPSWQFGQTVVYTVIRAGNRLDVPVVLGHYPLGAVLVRSWGVFLFLLAFQPVGLFVFLRRPHEPAARLFFLSASCVLAGGFAWSLGLQVSDLIGGTGFWMYRVPLRGAYMLSYVGQLHFALIFPRKLPFVVRHPRAIRLMYAGSFALYGLFIAISRFAASSTLHWLGWWTPAERSFTFVYFILTILVAVRRYEGLKSDRVARYQLRWIVYALVLSGGLSTFFGYLPEISLGHPLVNWNTLVLFFLPLPLSFAVAILRYRLFDIDIIINRTLVYGTLTALVAALYVLVVGSLGLVFQARSSLVTSVVATGVVAIVFQPLRDRVQRAVNRLMYGERDDPYRVLTRLGQRLEVTLAPDAVLSTIVETIAQALKLPYTAIVLKDQQTFTVAATYGLLKGEPLRLPLVYQAEIVGQLILAPRSPDEAFTSSDLRLLDGLTHPVGMAVHAVRLTADLQRSREQLVMAREAERRRLRRDLHDGLGQALASQVLQLDAVYNLLRHDPVEARMLVTDLKTQTQNIIADIRRLVYELRPPALDELGLVPALREQAEQINQLDGLRISLEAPDYLPPLPAAVEVAAYRITLEALTNVVRHAHARQCAIRLALDNVLRLEIIDDGCGLPAHCRTGIGLTSIRERTTELGGTCIIQPAPAGGTQVLVSLPLPKEKGELAWSASAS